MTNKIKDIEDYRNGKLPAKEAGPRRGSDEWKEKISEKRSSKPLDADTKATQAASRRRTAELKRMKCEVYDDLRSDVEAVIGVMKDAEVPVMLKFFLKKGLENE